MNTGDKSGKVDGDAPSAVVVLETAKESAGFGVPEPHGTVSRR